MAKIEIAYFSHIFFQLCLFIVFMVKVIPHLCFYCGHFEWPEIWHADVFWPPSELNWLYFGHCLFIFLFLVAFWLRETGQMWDFGVFSWERKGRMSSDLACRCILSTWELFRFWSHSVDFPHFGLMKLVKFGVSRNVFRTHGKMA